MRYRYLQTTLKLENVPDFLVLIYKQVKSEGTFFNTMVVTGQNVPLLSEAKVETHNV